MLGFTEFKETTGQEKTAIDRFWDNLEKTAVIEPAEKTMRETAIANYWDNLIEKYSEGEAVLAEKIDDNGEVYEKDGKLLPNTKYTLNGSIYKTDSQGRIVSCEAHPQRTPENERDLAAQMQVGGEDRKPDDQGGHIIGRDVGGDAGKGNLVPMDSRINQSDYKRMENDVKRYIDEGKDVKTKTEIIYSGDSERPDKVITTVTVDGKDTVYTFDNNVDGSLIDNLSETCNGDDVSFVQDTLDETGGQISSIKEEYNENGNLEKTTVSITYVGEDGKNYRTQSVINHNGGDLK